MDISACVHDLRQYIAARGQKEGQRWIADPGELQAILEKHIAAPKPSGKKGAAKKDDTDADTE